MVPKTLTGHTSYMKATIVAILAVAIASSLSLSGCATKVEQREAKTKSSRLCIENNSESVVTVTFTRYDGIDGDPNATPTKVLESGSRVCGDGSFLVAPDVEVQISYKNWLAGGLKTTWISNATNAALLPAWGRIVDQQKQGICYVYEGESISVADGIKELTLVGLQDSDFKEFLIKISEVDYRTDLKDCVNRNYKGL